eukprot:Phypoly_transcript_00877.p1 GENE.Phypoly_transcript_00877~~Phypoly_transcript_00877.p1  ORF type:complete len:1286 (+),score=165.39 Phypoly_transcript_00877:53-3910(+)
MDITPNAFKAYIQASFVPVVVVLCTDGVEKLCQKQGFKFVDAFKSTPLEKRRTPIRFGDTNYDLQDLKLRFVELKELEKQDESKLAVFLANLVDDVTADTYCADVKLRDKASVPYFLKSLSLPWYEKYKTQFVINGPTVEQEFFHHPIACIIAASSEDKNPMASLVKLFDPAAPPSIFGEPYVESLVPRSYLYVYSSDVARDIADKRLSELKNTFPQTPCYLMKAETLYEAVTGGSPTTARTPDSNISIFLSEFVSKCVAPYFEKHMTELNEVITTSKKGLLQKFKITFSRKAGEKSEAEANSAAGELATRKLGDLLFFLHDYESALNYYKNCAKDFNNERTWHFYAAAQEMVGLCSYFVGRDTEQFFENAYVYYQKSTQSRYVVRSSFFYGDILKMRGNFKSASDVFIRAAEKDCEMFCSGLFQEQAAFCHLLTTPVMFRKFCFRMVMAGSRFQEVLKRKHARRCYEIAYRVYEDRNWSAVDDQLHQGLLRIAYYLGRIDEAVMFGHKLLVKNSLPFQKQNSLVREFLFICKANTKPSDPMPVIPLPIVVNESIKVHLHDYDDSAADWEILEAAFRIETDPFSAPRQRQGFDLWKMKDDDDLVNKERIVVSEEYVTVEVEVKNPLQVPLQFTHVHLVGTFHSSPDPPQVPVHTFKFSFDEFVEFYAPNQPSSPNSAQPDQKTLPFRVEPFDILLGPSDTKKLVFAVQPLKAGQLTIKGLGLYMCGSVWGRRELKKKKKKLNRTPTQRKAVMYEPNRCLTFKVTDPMPRLEVDCVNFPGLPPLFYFFIFFIFIFIFIFCFWCECVIVTTDVLYRGELRQAGLRLRNCSSRMGLKNVRVRCSHPNAVLFGERSNPTRRNGESVSLDVELDPGAELIVPIWIHFSTSSPSNQSMRFLFYYESEMGNSDLKYRLARCSANVSVKPAVVLKAATHPAPSDLCAYLLHLELSNTDNQLTFTFQQITCLSTQWRIVSLSEGTEKGDIPQDVFTLKPGQSSNTFFRIKRISEDPPTPSTCASLPIQSSICTNPSHKPVSVFSFPFHNFLEKEKSPETFEVGKLGSSSAGLLLAANLTNPNEEEQNKVDILLFWESSGPIGGGSHIYGQLSIPQVSFVPSQHAPITHTHSRNSLSLPLPTLPPTPRIVPSPSISVLHNLVAVRFLIECPTKITHDFNDQGLCVTPLQLHIANCSNHSPLSFDIFTLSPQEEGEGEPDAHHVVKASASQYLWCGTTTHRVDSLVPQGKTQLTLSACFFKPGVYNLTRFKLTTQGTNNTTIYAPFQHLITIEQQA